jgi:selenocysteine-specific elongation factor
MIVGTAGHIDHGKTTLVQALTGVDTDRLPEEKKRGITIELGYAFMDAGASEERIGFIDVPGHERLVHTMLAGATGIDFALLLVAADDGVMPQTREHLAVLSLLGVARGAVVVTKCDRADAARLAVVCADAKALVDGTSLAGAPVLQVSAPSGVGIGALRQLLIDAAATTRRASPAGAGLRLAVDRAFSVDGVGTVVTGTVHAGTVAIGDELTLTPTLLPGARHFSARVRSLHAQNRAVQRASAGQRCAVGLVGVAKDQIQRGQWLVDPAVTLQTQRIDVELTLWPAEARALRSGTSVHVHIGACTTTATVALLGGVGDVGGDRGDDGDGLAPGASALVQIVLREPVAAWHGDRIVLRDASASRTIAGGRVLDPHAPSRYRRTPQRLAELDALAHSTPAKRRDALIAAAPHGVDLRRLRIAEGSVGGEAFVAAADGSAAPLLAVDSQGEFALGCVQAEAARSGVLAALTVFHQQHPDELGPDAARLRRLSLPRLGEPLWRALLAQLQAAQLIGVRGAFVHLPEHGVRLSATDEQIAQKIAPMLRNQQSFEGVWARDLARDVRLSEPLLRVAIARLAQRGELHRVVRDLIYAPESMVRLAQIARDVAAAQVGVVTAAAFRDATQLGRKRAIQILEYFDRIGLLRRVGDEHRLRSDSTLFIAVSNDTGDVVRKDERKAGHKDEHKDAA